MRYVAGQRLLWQPSWAWARNNPKAYGQIAYFQGYTGDGAIIRIAGLSYFVHLDELRPAPVEFPETDAQSLHNLLEKNRQTQLRIRLWSGICLAIAGFILLTLLLRSL
jgi:hypothetical protein